MNKLAKIVSIVIPLLILISSCKDKGNTSPYGELLIQSPYAGISDSIKRDPSNDELYFRRAVLLNTNNLAEPALADFKKAWSIKKDERYAFGIGNLLLDRKPDSAILFLEEAVQELPASHLLQLTLARSYDAGNKTEEALAVCDIILKQNPQQVDALKMKAALIDKKGNAAEAIALLEKAYSLTPFDAELNYELAFKYAETKNAKVLGLCDSLIRKDSLKIHAEPYYYKGIYYSNTGHKAAALTQFNEAIQHDYYYLNAYIEKGRIYFDQKKYTDALKVFELANTISATFPDAYYWMGRCQEAMGQKEEAKLNYQRAYGLDDSFTEAKEAAGRL
ncbi:MAG TPA: tetratricopeptide repeat protein [Chitinophagaceae bacterium]|nr:tetratricopeptide repeat protein [Chitinophagaceae bacterium]